MRNVLLLCLTVIAVFAFGAQCVSAGEFPTEVSEAFETASIFTLFSLDPDFQWQQLTHPKTKPTNAEKFHSWPVLGKVSSLSIEERKKLREALAKGVRENQGEVAACFNPRHGIHMQNGKESIDLVICFQCDQIEIFKNGTKVRSLLTTSVPTAAFNEPLNARKVPLAARPR